MRCCITISARAVAHSSVPASALARLPRTLAEGSMNANLWLAVLALTLPCAVAARPHVHGAATLEIAIEAEQVELRLVSPLESLLGFEHAPRTEAQRTATREMEKTLARPESLLIPTAAARYVFRCQQPDALKSIEVGMFERFPRLHRVDVRVVGPRRQKAGRVTPAQTTFAW
jgi:hypothetical protein